MQAHQEPKSLDQAPIEILYLILNDAELNACIHFLMTTKKFSELFHDIHLIKLSRLKNLTAEIIQAIDPERKWPDMENMIKSAVFQKNINPYEEICKDQCINLYYANYRHPVAVDQHIVFKTPHATIERKFYLTCDVAKKNIPNYPSLKSFSIFKLPLNKINWLELCEKQFTRYPEALPQQPVRFIFR